MIRAAPFQSSLDPGSDYDDDDDDEYDDDDDYVKDDYDDDDPLFSQAR